MRHEANFIQREKGDVVADGSETTGEEHVCEAHVLVSCAESRRDHREELVPHLHLRRQYAEG